MKKDLTLVIVNWNTKELLLNCLESIFCEKIKITYQVVVVDNGSNDRSPQAVESKFPQALLIKNNSNLGFSKANNQGIKVADSRYVMLLNSDTVVHHQSLEKLINFLDTNPSVCAAGPKLLNTDGTVQKEGYYRKFPSLGQVILFYTSLRRWSSKIPYLVNKYWEDFDENKTMEVEQIPGAALFVRNSVLKKVGLLEERYPIWFEDVDWCYRAKNNGCKLMFYNEAVITHHGGKSFSLWSEKRKMLQLFSSMYLFFLIHKGRIYAEAVRAIILAASLASLGFNFIRKIASRPGFKQQDYEARIWFVQHFLKLEDKSGLPKV